MRPGPEGSAGVGGIKGRDGFETLGSLNTLGGIVLPDVELYEQVYPVQYRQWEFRRDGAGAGEFRGGTGVVYEIAVTEPAKWGLRGEGFYTPSGFGTNGGLPGREAVSVLNPGTAEEEPTPQYLIQEQSVCCVPWDEAGPYLRFSVTYQAQDEREEDALMAETVDRLGRLGLRF